MRCRYMIFLNLYVKKLRCKEIGWRRRSCCLWLLDLGFALRLLRLSGPGTNHGALPHLTYLRPRVLSGLAGLYSSDKISGAIDDHIAVNSSLCLSGALPSFCEIGSRTVCSCLTSQVRWMVDFCQVKKSFNALPKSMFLIPSCESYMRLNEIK